VLQPWRRWQRYVMAASIVPAGGILLSLTAPWWPGQICSNWTLHAAFALLPGLIICAWRPRWAFAILLVMGIGSWRWIAAGYEPRLEEPAAARPLMHVVSANIAEWNPWRPSAIVRAGRDHPDLLCLIETTEQDHRALMHDPRWPYQIWTLGIGLLSDVPFTTHAVSYTCETPVLEGTIAFGDSRLRILAWHALSPRSPARQRLRDRQLTHMAELVRSESGPTLLLGDFNLTVGDPEWRVFASASGLMRPVHEAASWPSLLGPGGITIDHLLGRQVAISTVKPVWLLGSDHLGISATCAPASVAASPSSAPSSAPAPAPSATTP